MRKKIIPLLTISFLFSCKQFKIDKVFDFSPKVNNLIIKNERELNYSNCFSTDDIEQISDHYKKMEEAIKLGIEYDFSSSPVEYSEKDISWMKRILKKNICRGKIKKGEDTNSSCLESIIYNIDCSETIIIDNEERFSEQDYWDILIKKNGRAIISKSGIAG